MVLESGSETQLGKWIRLLSCAKDPLEVCGHIIKVGQSQCGIGGEGGTRDWRVLRRVQLWTTHIALFLVT